MTVVEYTFKLWSVAPATACVREGSCIAEWRSCELRTALLSAVSSLTTSKTPIRKIVGSFTMPLIHHLKRMVPLSSRRTSHRSNSTYQPPDPPKTSGNRHGAYYKTFGRPVAKSFLIALCTYQLLYLGWLKLESLELKKDKDEEVRSLEGELRSLTKNKTAS